jgi:hypothetical protein
MASQPRASPAPKPEPRPAAPAPAPAPNPAHFRTHWTPIKWIEKWASDLMAAHLAVFVNMSPEEIHALGSRAALIGALSDPIRKHPIMYMGKVCKDMALTRMLTVSHNGTPHPTPYTEQRLRQAVDWGTPLPAAPAPPAADVTAAAMGSSSGAGSSSAARPREAEAEASGQPAAKRRHVSNRIVVDDDDSEPDAEVIDRGSVAPPPQSAPAAAPDAVTGQEVVDFMRKTIPAAPHRMTLKDVVAAFRPRLPTRDKRTAFMEELKKRCRLVPLDGTGGGTRWIEVLAAPDGASSDDEMPEGLYQWRAARAARAAAPAGAVAAVAAAPLPPIGSIACATVGQWYSVKHVPGLAHAGEVGKCISAGARDLRLDFGGGRGGRASYIRCEVELTDAPPAAAPAAAAPAAAAPAAAAPPAAAPELAPRDCVWTLQIPFAAAKPNSKITFDISELGCFSVTVPVHNHDPVPIHLTNVTGEVCSLERIRSAAADRTLVLRRFSVNGEASSTVRPATLRLGYGKKGAPCSAITTWFDVACPPVSPSRATHDVGKLDFTTTSPFSTVARAVLTAQLQVLYMYRTRQLFEAMVLHPAWPTRWTAGVNTLLARRPWSHTHANAARDVLYDKLKQHGLQQVARDASLALLALELRRCVVQISCTAAVACSHTLGVPASVLPAPSYVQTVFDKIVFPSVSAGPGYRPVLLLPVLSFDQANALDRADTKVGDQALRILHGSRRDDYKSMYASIVVAINTLRSAALRDTSCSSSARMSVDDPVRLNETRSRLYTFLDRYKHGGLSAPVINPPATAAGAPAAAANPTAAAHARRAAEAAATAAAHANAAAVASGAAPVEAGLYPEPEADDVEMTGQRSDLQRSMDKLKEAQDKGQVVDLDDD